MIEGLWLARTLEETGHKMEADAIRRIVKDLPPSSHIEKSRNLAKRLSQDPSPEKRYEGKLHALRVRGFDMAYSNQIPAMYGDYDFLSARVGEDRRDPQQDFRIQGNGTLTVFSEAAFTEGRRPIVPAFLHLIVQEAGDSQAIRKALRGGFREPEIHGVTINISPYTQGLDIVHVPQVVVDRELHRKVIADFYSPRNFPQPRVAEVASTLLNALANSRG